MKLATVVVAVAMLSGTVAASGQTADAAAKSVSAIRILKAQCGSFYAIRLDRLSQIEGAFLEARPKMDGGENFQKLLVLETERRAKEVRGLGASDWCKHKKTEYMASGMAMLFE